MAASNFPPRSSGLGLARDRGDELEAVDGDHSGEVLSVRGDRDRFVAGEISRDDFVEREVERATAHLAEHLPGERLEAVRAILRDEMSENPVFRDLLDRVRQSA